MRVELTASQVTNIRSLIRKRDKLYSVIDNCDANIVVLNETWLSAKISDAELFPVRKRLNEFRQGRELRNGGGVLIGVRNCISSSYVIIKSTIKIIFFYITIHYQRSNPGCGYCPPSCDVDFVEKLDVLNTIVTRFPNTPPIFNG